MSIPIVHFRTCIPASSNGGIAIHPIGLSADRTDGYENVPQTETERSGRDRSGKHRNFVHFRLQLFIISLNIRSRRVRLLRLWNISPQRWKLANRRTMCQSLLCLKKSTWNSRKFCRNVVSKMVSLVHRSIIYLLSNLFAQDPLSWAIRYSIPISHCWKSNGNGLRMYEKT